MREIAINTLAQALINNRGNRITDELINGIAHSVDAVMRQAEASMAPTPADIPADSPVEG